MLLNCDGKGEPTLHPAEYNGGGDLFRVRIYVAYCKAFVPQDSYGFWLTTSSTKKWHACGENNPPTAVPRTARKRSMYAWISKFSFRRLLASKVLLEVSPVRCLSRKGALAVSAPCFHHLAVPSVSAALEATW